MTPTPRTSSAPLSVLVVSHAAGVWGAQRRLLDLAPHLAADGIELAMACPTGELSERWREAGLPHEPLELPPHQGVRDADGHGRPGPLTLAGEVLAVARSAGAIARRARAFDLVQSHSLWAHLETALAGRISRRPVVLDLHDIVSAGMGRRVLGLAARLATLTLANSAATASTVAAPGKTVIVHPGVDLDRFHPGPAAPGVRAELTADPTAPLVAIIGRVDPNKGVDVLIDAVAACAAGRPPHLVVIGREQVGDPQHMEAIRRRAAERLGARARFLPPRDDVPDVLRAVDVLVNASRHEPFGRTVLEAQACGTPVIGTAAGGIPEFVADGETGLLVPPFDPGAMSAALERLLGDDDLRAHLAKRGIDQARTRFGLPAQASAVAMAYRRATGR